MSISLALGFIQSVTAELGLNNVGDRNRRQKLSVTMLKPHRTSQHGREYKLTSLFKKEDWRFWVLGWPARNPTKFSRLPAKAVLITLWHAVLDCSRVRRELLQKCWNSENPSKLKLSEFINALFYLFEEQLWFFGIYICSICIDYHQCILWLRTLREPEKRVKWRDSESKEMREK